MRLNLPVWEEIAACENLLIAGMGGGFDVFCGLPIYFELRRHGKTVHLANLTFADVQYAKNAVQLSDSLVGVTAETKSVLLYFPELHLARWLKEARGEEATVWCLYASAARPLLAAYQMLAEHLSVDGILLVDGGVDSLMRGDEAEMGTVLEDALSLAAVSQLGDMNLRQIACIGMGTEQDLTHAHTLENMSALTEQGAFLGSCALIRKMEAYQAYEAAVTFVHSQRSQDPSIINASIISAAQGKHGDFHLTEKTKGNRLYISPLMPLYWFFDLPAVAERNLFLRELRRSDTRLEAMTALAHCRQLIPSRPATRIPLK
jgi:hypothetical protein